MLPSVITIVLLFPIGSLDSWWLTMRTQPTEKTVLGLKASAINARWTHVALLDEPDLSEQPSSARSEMASEGFAFTQDVDIDGDGQLERAVVGVYRDRDDRYGRFLLLVKRTTPRAAWEKFAVFSDPGEPGYSAVAVGSYALEWSKCLQCDSSCSLVRKLPLKLKCESCCGPAV